ncbi:MAG TPA: RIP metalloprotease RseP [Vicinamibacterales bacterium]|nr:RIP metalloprotease RseP [Vicinamibacterales bacterium]
MLQSLQTLASFLFVLGVLVFVHELGHFLAAKRVGIRVLKFQLGFNPTIFSFKRGDTEYGIGALPLGGYVKMAGESPEEERTGKSDEFLSKSKWERFQVLFMGPAMNLILAVVVSAIVLHQGAQVPVYEDQPAIVGTVTEGSPAASVGIRRGDHIKSVNGHDVPTWRDLLIAIGTKPNREVTLVIDRDGREITEKVTTVKAEGDQRFEIGDIGVMPDVHPRLTLVDPNDAGGRSGLKVGDILLAVDGKTLTYHTQFREAIASHPEKPMSVLVLRDGHEKMLTVTPARKGSTGWLGVLPEDETKSITPGPIEAIQMSVEENVKTAGLIFQTIWGLLTRETSPKQLMGPVAIAQLSGESAQLGWVALLSLMASISLNLGLLNLMPIPVLDGGHITIMALEGLARRDFSKSVKEKMVLAGLAVLMMLMVTVIYNDLTRITWIERFMPWR